MTACILKEGERAGAGDACAMSETRMSALTSGEDCARRRERGDKSKGGCGVWQWWWWCWYQGAGEEEPAFIM